MKETIINIMRFISLPLAYTLPLSKWQYWMGRVHGIKLYKKVKANDTISTAGSANINIIIDLLKNTNNLDGDVAECGVFKGSTIVGIGYYLKTTNSDKKVLGFDSFEGFSGDDLNSDLSFSMTDDIKNEAKLFKNNSFERVEKKLKMVNVSDNIELIKGYFNETLPNYSSKSFCFVHLDCDLYEPYKYCLDFFYPRMVKGGIILFDEYNDPVYKKCNLAIDEFLSDKTEKLQEIVRDNQIRYFIKKE